MSNLQNIFKDYSKAFGVSILVGGRNKEVRDDLVSTTQEYQGRTDVILVDSKERHMLKKGPINERHGPALYWSSTIPNLEYSIAFIESDAPAKIEKFSSLVHEYWQVVKPGGLLMGDDDPSVTQVVKDIFGEERIIVKDGYWMIEKPMPVKRGA